MTRQAGRRSAPRQVFYRHSLEKPTIRGWRIGIDSVASPGPGGKMQDLHQSWRNLQLGPI